MHTVLYPLFCNEWRSKSRTVLDPVSRVHPVRVQSGALMMWISPNYMRYHVLCYSWSCQPQAAASSCMRSLVWLTYVVPQSLQIISLGLQDEFCPRDLCDSKVVPRSWTYRILTLFVLCISCMASDMVLVASYCVTFMFRFEGSIKFYSLCAKPVHVLVRWNAVVLMCWRMRCI